MAKILVTGATGFIGTHLVLKLRQVGHEVIEANSQSGDIADESTWSGFPQTEVVVHLAAKTFVPDSWVDPAAFIKCNLLGTVAALNYCKKHNARLVFLSSYLYGNPQLLPIPENAPLVAMNPYALSKKLAEEVCHFYAASFGINITIFRPFNIYGPGQPDNFLIPSIIRQLSENKVIQVKDLNPKRDYVYITDLVDAIIKAIDKTSGLNIFNIGSGKSYSVAELIQILQDIKKTNLHVISTEDKRRDEIMDCVADITRANRHLGWKPAYSLTKGLESLLNTNRKV